MRLSARHALVPLACSNRLWSPVCLLHATPCSGVESALPFNSPWIYTMPRCLSTAAAALALAVPMLAAAQLVRALPTNTLRGEAVFGQPPQLLLNGQPARLSPGARIKSPDNMLVLSGALIGQKLTVNYTVDTYGLLMDVWLLRDEDIVQPWPTTLQEAATWAYNPITKTWVKP